MNVTDKIHLSFSQNGYYLVFYILEK